MSLMSFDAEYSINRHEVCYYDLLFIRMSRYKFEIVYVRFQFKSRERQIIYILAKYES